MHRSRSCCRCERRGARIPVPRAGVEGQCLGLGGTRAGDDAEGRCGPGTAVSTVLWRRAGAAAAGFPDPRKHPYTPSADMVRESEPKNRRPKAVTGQAGGRDSEVLELLEIPAGQAPPKPGNAHMTTMEPAPRQVAVAVKVSPEGDRLITSGAHYLRMSKKDLVEAAVVFYLNAGRRCRPACGNCSANSTAAARPGSRCWPA